MNSTGVEITAGLGGFLVLFGLALAVWFLGRDLTRRLRRMRAAEDRRREQESSRQDAASPRRDARPDQESRAERGARNESDTRPDQDDDPIG